MPTMPRLKPVLRPGIGWQLWTPAALPLLVSCAGLITQPASGMTITQRALIAETLCCLRVQLPPWGPCRTDRLQRAVDALARGGVWLWWRQRDRAPQLDLLFLRVGG
jgi:hypothetical protein